MAKKRGPAQPEKVWLLWLAQEDEERSLIAVCKTATVAAKKRDEWRRECKMSAKDFVIDSVVVLE